jgi:hypothetical protein
MKLQSLTEQYCFTWGLIVQGLSQRWLIVTQHFSMFFVGSWLLHTGHIGARTVHWTFGPKQNIHWTFSPLWYFLTVTIGLKVDGLYIHPKNEHLDPKIGAKCHNVTFKLPVIRLASPVTFHPYVTICVDCFMSDFPHKLWHFLPQRHFVPL